MFVYRERDRVRITYSIIFLFFFYCAQFISFITGMYDTGKNMIWYYHNFSTADILESYVVIILKAWCKLGTGVHACSLSYVGS